MRRSNKNFAAEFLQGGRYEKQNDRKIIWACLDTIGLKADIYRIGGDEFVCISESNVLPYISQFKDTISFIDREKLYKLAVSIGYSKYHEKYTKSIDDIIRRADEKMYKAKKDKK